MKCFITSSVLILVFLQIVAFAASKNVYTELETLKPKQKETLAAFKQAVISIVPHDYMKEDIFLIKYLQFNDFNLRKAEEHLKEVLKWRKENEVDKIATNPPADFAAFEKDYPVYVDGYDNEDRPICEVPYGSWAVRKAAAAGLTKRLSFYTFMRCAERASVKIREQQALGKNISSFIFLANTDGFSVSEHVCPSCVPLALNLALGNDRYYPLMCTGLWIINVPDSFATLLRIIRPVMSASSRAALKIFSSNKNEWEPFLKKKVDFSQISDWYGGGKERKS